MSNLLRAKKNPVFRWNYRWVPLDDSGLPRRSNLQQPETIRLRFMVPDEGSGSRGRMREASADVVPDNGDNGPEFALVFTFRQFQSLVYNKLDANAQNFTKNLYELLEQCMQGKALAILNVL